VTSLLERNNMFFGLLRGRGSSYIRREARCILHWRGHLGDYGFPVKRLST